MRLVFAGTPEAALPTLRVLAESAHDVVAVVTRADAPLGRKRVLTPSPVAALADRLGIPVIKTNRLDDEVTAQIAALAPDLGVIVAYGGLVRAPLLAVPVHGWINLHFSSLPAWRGAAPVQRAVMAGDESIGACVFQLVAELDAGDVFAELTEPVDGRTAGEMLQTLSVSGAHLLAGVVDEIAQGTANAVPQQGEVTVAAKLSAADGRIDFTRPASVVVATAHGVTPEPGASTELRELRIKLLDVRPAADAGLAPGRIALIDGHAVVGTGDGSIELVSVQPAGKKPMSGAAWARGVHDIETAVLS